MKNYTFFLLTFIIIFSFNGYLKQLKLATGNKKHHEEVADEGYKSEDILKKLCNFYCFNSNVDGAVKWYKELFDYCTGNPALSSDEKILHFASDLTGKSGQLGICKFIETRKLQCIYELNGIITDTGISAILSGVKIMLYECTTTKDTKMTDPKRSYALAVECGKAYNVRTEKEEYNSKEVIVIIEKLTGKRSLSIALDKSNITTGVALILEKIHTMKFDIHSHRDRRATQEYNDILTNRRVKLIMKGITKNDIVLNQLTGKGCVETRLVKKCSDGMHFIDEEHKMSRISEFAIIVCQELYG